MQSYEKKTKNLFFFGFLSKPVLLGPLKNAYSVFDDSNFQLPKTQKTTASFVRN